MYLHHCLHHHRLKNFSGTWATCTPWMPSTHQTQLTKIFSHTTRCNRWWRQNKPDLWSSTKRQLWPKDHVQPIFFERIWLSGDKDVEERGTGDPNLHQLCPWVQLVLWPNLPWTCLTCGLNCRKTNFKLFQDFARVFKCLGCHHNLYQL